MGRRSEKLFGWIAIVAGVAIVVAVAAGIALPSFVLIRSRSSCSLPSPTAGS